MDNIFTNFFFYENNLVLRNRNCVHTLQLDLTVDCRKKPIWITIWLKFIELKNKFLYSKAKHVEGLSYKQFMTQGL